MFSKNKRFSFKGKLPKNIFSSSSFNLRFEKNDEEGLRTAVVVSKKVDKRATVRNKIKRRLIEALKANIKEDEGLTLVFYLKKQALENPDLNKEIRDALEKIASSLRS